MMITEYCSTAKIQFFQEGTSKDSIVETIVRSFDGIDAVSALQAIQAREQIGRTELSTEVVIPHARLSGLDRIHAGVGITPTLIYIVFVSPANAMSQHLAFLSGLAALFQTDGLSQRLRSQNSASEVFALLRQEDVVPAEAV